METKDERRKRKLQMLCDAVNGGAKVVAERSGLNSQNLTQVLAGTLLPPKKDGTRSPRALGDLSAESIEDAFKLGRGWFDSPASIPWQGQWSRLTVVSGPADSGIRFSIAEPEPSPIPFGAHAVRNQRAVPVLGRGQGGLPERIWDDGGHPVGETGEVAEVATTDAQSFVIRVEGRSMEPRYMSGEYALVEPNTVPEIEDDVLVRLVNDGTMLKRLLGRRGGWRFGSYNDPAVLTYSADEVAWVYYVAHPVPARKIKQRT